jgi:hypothetical protein
MNQPDMFVLLGQVLHMCLLLKKHNLFGHLKELDLRHTLMMQKNLPDNNDWHHKVCMQRLMSVWCPDCMCPPDILFVLQNLADNNDLHYMLKALLHSRYPLCRYLPDNNILQDKILGKKILLHRNYRLYMA